MSQARKKRLGDRRDAHKLRTLTPMSYVAVAVMNKRNDAMNLFSSTIDCASIDEYIRKKRETMPGFGFMHLMVAAYVRTVSQKPGINRYIAGLRIFSRHEIVLSMMVKKELKLNAQETAIKVRFAPTDTAEDVYRKMEEAIQNAAAAGDTTNLDKVARIVNYMPSIILRWFVSLMAGLDFIGLLPRAIEEASPFHCSMFLSNLGSLGIPPIYHHLYNFGNTSLFITFGAKHRVFLPGPGGEAEPHMLIDYTVVSDERITDGHYFASALKMLEKIMRSPEKLDTPPETVIEDID